jgi:DNA-binding transcriptional LysR family regulator
MDTDLLRTFVAVANRGSITASAAALGYTQSAVSRQIASLEARTGATLFVRKARGVDLTYHGRALLPYAESILRLAGEAAAELVALDRLEAGALRLGGFPTANAALVPRAIAAFSRAHPRVSITLAEGTTRRQLTRLEMGDIDLAVISAFPGQPLPDTHATLEHLLDDQMYVAVPPGHPLAGRRTVHLTELTGDRWIAGDVRDDDRMLSPVHLLPAFEGTIAFLVREWTAKLGMVAAGLGITVVSSLAIGAARSDIALIPVDAASSPRRRVYAATARDRPPPPAREQFLAFLRTEASRWNSPLPRPAQAGPPPVTPG